MVFRLHYHHQKENLCTKLGIERKPGGEKGKQRPWCVSLNGFRSGQGFENRNLRLCCTCLSDLPQQVKISSLPLILTQINIKLNTRPGSVNFMWLRMIGFLLHHTARIKEHETPMRVPVSQWNPFPISPLRLIHVSNACKHQWLLPGLSENMEHCYIECMRLQDVFLNIGCNL